jgi:Protein of unknown function (DUF2628)
MQTYTVHEPPHPPADRIDRAASLVFVKDGFSWGAALFAPFWLLAHRLWWPLLGYIVLSGLLELARWVGMLDPRWATMAMVTLHLLVGFEADTLRRWALEHRGWRTLGSVLGRNYAECERRFFDEWLPDQPVIAPAASPTSPRIAPPPRKTPVIGSLLGIRS